MNEDRQLYLVKARQCQPKKAAAEALTPLGALRGDYERDGNICNDGHERGLLHSLTAPYLLCWRVYPGDEIVASFWVEGYHRRRGSSLDDYTDPLSTVYSYPILTDYRVDRYLSVDHGWVVVDFSNHPGRSPMLGEDTLDAVYGGCALTEFLEHSLASHDFRRNGRLACDARFRFMGDSEDFGPLQVRVTEQAEVAQ